MKKILLSLFGIITLGLINFSSAGSYTFTGNISRTVNSSTSTSSTYATIQMGSFIPYNYYSNIGGTFDIDCTISNLNSNGLNFVLDNSSRGFALYLSYIDITTNIASYNRLYPNPALILQNGNFHYTLTNSNSDNYYYGLGFQTYYSRPVSTMTTFTFDYSCTVSGDNFVGDTSSGGTCDYSDYELKSDITESYCKNKFSSLMTSSDCDILYSGYVSPSLYQNCTNSLNSCSGELGVCNSSLNSCLNGNYTGNVQWSAIWINNIQHLGNKNIYIDIPEEISWDYLYTGDNMLIGVEGYNVDTEYIQSVINKQNYIPTTEDFSNVFSNFGLFGGLLVVCLFVIFVFYIIKKIFS